MISYDGAHERLRRTRGVARSHKCLHCDQRAEQWAYNHCDPDELTSSSGPRQGRAYSEDPKYYVPLCISHHRKFDIVMSRMRKLVSVG